MREAAIDFEETELSPDQNEAIFNWLLDDRAGLVRTVISHRVARLTAELGQEWLDCNGRQPVVESDAAVEKRVEIGRYLAFLGVIEQLRTEQKFKRVTIRAQDL